MFLQETLKQIFYLSKGCEIASLLCPVHFYTLLTLQTQIWTNCNFCLLLLYCIVLEKITKLYDYTVLYHNKSSSSLSWILKKFRFFSLGRENVGIPKLEETVFLVRSLLPMGQGKWKLKLDLGSAVMTEGKAPPLFLIVMTVQCALLSLEQEFSSCS